MIMMLLGSILIYVECYFIFFIKFCFLEFSFMKLFIWMGLFIINWIFEKKFLRVGCSVSVIVSEVMFNDVIMGVIDIFMVFNIIKIVNIVKSVLIVLLVIVLVFLIMVDWLW